MSTAEGYAAEREKWRNFPRVRPSGIVAPGPGQESVWDYPRPPRVEAVSRRVRVEFAGRVLAETTSALRVCENSSPPCYYIPPHDVDLGALVRVSGPASASGRVLPGTGRCRGTAASPGTQLGAIPSRTPASSPFAIIWPSILAAWMPASWARTGSLPSPASTTAGG